MVWPFGGRGPTSSKHAFEDVLDAARLDPEGGLVLDADASPLGPAVGSLGDIPVASGYVAPASLARAYGDKEPEDPVVVARPRDAAVELKASLAAATHGAADLQKMRRRFAARNHPDRVPEDLRDEAVAAMAEVNAAIDKALKLAKG